MFLLPWAFMIGFSVADEIVFTMLLRIQYAKFRSIWETDGHPRSVFWIPVESRIGRWHVTYASGHQGNLARWRWLFKTPGWAAQAEDSRLLLLLHRVLLIAFVACAFAPFAIAAWLQSSDP